MPGQSSAGPSGPNDVTVASLESGDVELIAPLWRTLLDHVATLPDAVVPVRPFEQSWPMERDLIREALVTGSFVLVARRRGALVGYTFVRIETADPVWYTGDRYAEVVHLCVADDERGNGIGSLLLDVADEELLRRGIDDVQIGVDAANHDALRFYERRGYRADYQVVYGSPARRSWACVAREAADRAAERGRFAAPRPAPPARSPAPAATPGLADRGAHRYVSVIGGSSCGPDDTAMAEELGELLARHGLIVICGGGPGVMAAVARGAERGGGVCIGILPEEDRRLAGPDLTYSICSGIGHARNLGVVASGDAVIAVGGAWGTLSEIGLARAIGRPVVLLRSWSVAPPSGGIPDGAVAAATPLAALESVLSAWS